MIRCITLSLVCCLLLACTGAVFAADTTDVVVFAAASMTKVMGEIQEAFEAANPQYKLIFTFDSSGTLKTQIEEGAECDVFISAGQKQMNQLDISKNEEKNPDKLDFVVENTRFNLLENQVVLVVPAGNPAKIESFDDLGTDKLKLLAIGNSDVPVGQYAAEILTNLGLYDALNDAGKITFGTNTTEVTTQVAEATVDAGIVYKTDVASAVDPKALEIIAAAPEGTLKTRVIYPAAAMKSGKNVDGAKVFLAYLKEDEAKTLLEKYGFTTDFE